MSDKTTPTEALVPVTETTSLDEIVKVNDTANRTWRGVQDFGGVAVVVGLVNRVFGFELTIEEGLVIAGMGFVAWTFFRNYCEWKGWLPSMKDPAAEIAPPTNHEGDMLAQPKPIEPEKAPAQPDI